MVGAVDDRPLSAGPPGRRVARFSASAHGAGGRARARSRPRATRSRGQDPAARPVARTVVAQHEFTPVAAPRGSAHRGTAAETPRLLRRSWRAHRRGSGSAVARTSRHDPGPGGAGKTSLAIEVGRRITCESHRRAVTLIELASLPRGGDVVGAAASVLAVGDGDLRVTTGPASDMERIIDTIGNRPMLLIVDNCEHVVNDAATLASTLLR